METYRDELLHYGVPGMRWGVRNERQRDPRYHRVKRVNRTGNVNGKQYTQSRATARANRKAQKSLMRSVVNPSRKNILNEQYWNRKSKYENYRDKGRTSKTKAVTRTGIGVGAAGAAVTGLGIAAALGASTMALPITAIGAGTIATGRAIAKASAKREFKSGYRLTTGSKKYE